MDRLPEDLLCPQLSALADFCTRPRHPSLPGLIRSIPASSPQIRRPAAPKSLQIHQHIPKIGFWEGIHPLDRGEIPVLCGG
jgi:hypothetical protein